MGISVKKISVNKKMNTTCFVASIKDVTDKN